MQDIKIKLESNRFITDKDCWNWTGGLNGNGYGELCIAYKMYFTHRLSAHIYKGFDLSSRLHILHTCDNPRCFNPDHLYEGTQSRNIKDAYDRGRRKGNNLGGRSHCKRGHEFTPENTYLRKDNNTRACKTCRQLAEDKRNGRC